MNKEEKHIILHASGLSNSEAQYREHYCTMTDNSILNKLVSEGFFSGPHSNSMLMSGHAYFFLTYEGIKKAYELKEEGEG